MIELNRTQSSEVHHFQRLHAKYKDHPLMQKWQMVREKQIAQKQLMNELRKELLTKLEKENG